MAILTCPTDIVYASRERVWDLLTAPREIARWSHTTLLEGPERRIVVGDRLTFGAGLGRRLKVRFLVTVADPPEQLALEIGLPLGVVNHEVVRITPLGTGSCRVTYN